MRPSLQLNIRIGFFLAWRQIRHSSLWTTGLIVFVMVLTFLNLVVVSGVLVGLIQGSVNAEREQYTSDIIISAPPNKSYIENTHGILQTIRALPEVQAVSPRYRTSGLLEANYKTRKDTDKANTSVGQLVGINPVAEDTTTGLASHVIKGSYLSATDYDSVLIGSFLLKQYLPVNTPGVTALNNVDIGTKIRLTVNGIQREVTVKGIIKSKVRELSQSIFMIDAQLRLLIDRNNNNVSEISVKLKPDADPLAIRGALILSGVDRVAQVQTYADAQPQFLKDIMQTFSILGSVFSSVGLVVSSITIFIVIFINALTRRKFIGILKGIGINEQVIEISYVFQSIFYAVCGSVLGLLLLYGFLQPFLTAHPIDFPFSDGILVAPLDGTFLRIGLLVSSTIIAGYIPAWMVVRRNTLDSILGRN